VKRKFNFLHSFVCLLGLTMPLVAVAEPLCKKVNESWTWFSDHAVFSIDYGIAVEDGYSVRAATGVSIGGNPLGSRFDFSGTKEVSAYGVGALHITKTSGEGAAIVCVDQTGMTLISLSSALKLALPEDF
jgi:outer membrane protein assembly factor BamB